MRYQKMMKIGLFGLMITSLFFLTGCFGFFTDLFAPLPAPPGEIFVAPFDPEAIMVDPVTGLEIVSNQVLVRFRDNLARATIEAVIADLGCIIVGEIPALNIYQLKIPDGACPTDLVAQFEKSPHVRWAKVNHIVRPMSTPAGSTSESDPFKNPYFHEQWALHNTGQTGGKEGADIDALRAWAIEKGHPNVTIAILDTGVNYNHEDLWGNLRMPRGIEWDFVDYDTSPMDEGDPNEHSFGHGTEMAGVAVARMKNNRGVVGVAPYATFLPVRVMTQKGGTHAAIVAGIREAYEQGNARIFNMSFGSLRQSGEIEEVISEILEENDYVLFIAGAGNDNIHNPIPAFFPARHQGVMAVAATLHNDRRAPYSNSGYWVDVAAPGGCRETRWIRSTGLADDDGMPPHPNNIYGYTGGTSAATAHVSGVAALIWSLDYRTDGDFDLTASEVRDIIKNTADPIGHPGLGAGRVNAHRALLEAKIRLNQPPTARITTPVDGATFLYGESITFQGSATDPEDGTLTGTALVWSSNIDGQIGTGESFTRTLSVGFHNITLTATDRHGATGTDTTWVRIIAPRGLLDISFSPTLVPFEISPAGAPGWFYTVIIREINGVEVNLEGVHFRYYDAEGRFLFVVKVDERWLHRAFGTNKVGPRGNISGDFAERPRSPHHIASTVWRVFGTDARGHRVEASGVVHLQQNATRGLNIVISPPVFTDGKWRYEITVSETRGLEVHLRGACVRTRAGDGWLLDRHVYSSVRLAEIFGTYTILPGGSVTASIAEAYDPAARWLDWVVAGVDKNGNLVYGVSVMTYLRRPVGVKLHEVREDPRMVPPPPPEKYR